MADHYYCTLDDVKKKGLTLTRIIELTNDGKADTVNEGVFDGCRGSAAALIDSYCLTRYKDRIPFNPVPELIVTIAAKLTKYFLYDLKKATDTEINKMYDDQIRQLKDLSQGISSLGESGAIVPQDGVTFTAKTPEDRVSHLNNLQGYIL